TEAWNHGPWLADVPCVVDVGLSGTRTRARMVAPLDGVDMRLPRQTEKLMFRMIGRGGAAPRLEPFLPPPTSDPDRDALYRKLFPQIGAPDAALGIDDVTAVLWASSAFSFAFPPHTLKLSVRRPPGQAPAAERPDPMFTDGGVFDDRPAGLAVRMKRWALGAPGEAASRTRYIVQ